MKVILKFEVLIVMVKKGFLLFNSCKEDILVINNFVERVKNYY